jgi:hypothetical protein
MLAGLPGLIDERQYNALLAKLLQQSASVGITGEGLIAVLDKRSLRSLLSLPWLVCDAQREGAKNRWTSTQARNWLRLLTAKLAGADGAIAERHVERPPLVTRLVMRHRVNELTEAVLDLVDALVRRLRVDADPPAVVEIELDLLDSRAVRCGGPE